MLDGLGYFMLGMGLALLSVAFVLTLRGFLHARRNKTKFTEYVEDLKQFNVRLQEAMEERKEVSELTFRDKDGSLCTVKIVIDYNIDDRLSLEDRQKLRDMIANGGPDAGSLDDLISGHQYAEGNMDRVQQFVFSGFAVAAMRQRGLEPDDIVRRMLQASGRIS